MAKTTVGASATEKKKDMWMRAALLLLLLLLFVDANPRGFTYTHMPETNEYLKACLDPPWHPLR
jgi:hypothetical protein